MIMLLGKLLFTACAFGLAIRAFPDASAALSITAVVVLYAVMRHHFNVVKKQ